MKIAPWKEKLPWTFHYMTKRSVRNMGHRRETWVTWARQGHAGGSGKALLVIATARQQLTYAGHRKAELRRHKAHRALFVVLSELKDAFLVPPYRSHTLLQDCMGGPESRSTLLQSNTDDLAAIHEW